MGDCGCKPCSKPIPVNPKACKPFTMCVGNYSFIWDGSCASIQPRTYTIPDGTYTSITFTDGCITDVGTAPLPQYTPQQCCDTGLDAPKNNTGVTLSSSNTVGNLAVVQNNTVEVVPTWDTQGNIKVEGNGTADRPWKPSVRVSKQQGNNLVEKNDGLFANLFFETTNTVDVKGVGTQQDPYKLDVKGADAKLPAINKTDVEGNGFTIDEYGRWKVDGDLKVVTNISFDHEAFKVVDRGDSTVIMVDAPMLQQGVSLQVGDGISGKGVTGDPVKLSLDVATVQKILAVIATDDGLKQQLKQILEV